ncbi:MAG TPA: AtpZ/AtpI family protein [Terriglobales bacterium]|nr:AtpZ/AtpI family protein [Terriglobales bacterium]
MPKEQPEKSEKNNWSEVNNYIELAVIFPAATLIGWIIGHILDVYLHRDWIQFVGLGFGIAAGFIQLFRVGLKASRE